MTSMKSIAALFIIAVAVMLALGACSDHGTAVQVQSGDGDSTVSFAATVHPCCCPTAESAVVILAPIHSMISVWQHTPLSQESRSMVGTLSPGLPTPARSTSR